MQPVGTDQQIAADRAAIVEVDSRFALRSAHANHAGIAPDALGRKVLQQAFQQNPARNHRTGAPSPRAIAVMSSVASEWPVAVITRTADNGCPAPTMSTPSCPNTVAPFDQMVTAPPPG